MIHLHNIENNKDISVVGLQIMLKLLHFTAKNQTQTLVFLQTHGVVPADIFHNLVITYCNEIYLR